MNSAAFKLCFNRRGNSAFFQNVSIFRPVTIVLLGCFKNSYLASVSSDPNKMTPGRVAWQRAMSVQGIKFTFLFFVSLTECHQRQRTVQRWDETRKWSYFWNLGQGIMCPCVRLVHQLKVPCCKITISPYEAGTQRAFSLLRLSFTVSSLPQSPSPLHLSISFLSRGAVPNHLHPIFLHSLLTRRDSQLSLLLWPSVDLTFISAFYLLSAFLKCFLKLPTRLSKSQILIFSMHHTGYLHLAGSLP